MATNTQEETDTFGTLMDPDQPYIEWFNAGCDLNDDTISWQLRDFTERHFNDEQRGESISTSPAYPSSMLMYAQTIRSRSCRA